MKAFLTRYITFTGPSVIQNHQSHHTEKNYASTSGTKNLLDTFNDAAEDDDSCSTGKLNKQS